MQPETATSFRLSPQQERMWPADGEPTGRSLGVYLLEGPLDAARLRDGFLQVVGRHETLRTTFQRQTGMRLPAQAVHEQLAPEWEVDDLSVLAAGEQEARIEELVAALETRPWNLAEGPLARALLLSLGTDRHLLVLCVASVCADAASVTTVVRELAALYAGESVAAEPLQYADFAEWQHELLTSDDDDDAAAAKEFWSRDTDAHVPAVPFLRSGGTGRREAVTLDLEADTATAVADSATKYGIAPDVFAETAWLTVLGLLSGTDAFTVARVPRSRHHEELETAVGAFSSPLPVQAEVPAGAKFSELAVKVGHAEAQATRWQDYSPGADELSIAFTSTDPAASFAAGDLNVSLRSLAGDESCASLGLEWTQRDGSAAAVLSFDPEAFDRAQAERLAAYVERVLSQAASNPEILVDDLELLDADDVRRLTVDVNPAAPESRGVAVHDLFAGAAARAAEAPAVVDGVGSIAYGELDARANQLAHHLRRAGVGADVVVGLCTDRSIDMVVGMLGILKAGGAYLPLNFEHPSARIEHQLRETGAPVLVTQEPILGSAARLRGHEPSASIATAPRSTRSRPTLPSPAGARRPRLRDLHLWLHGATPKGVGVTHANLSSYVQAIAAPAGRGSGAARVRHGDGDLDRPREHRLLPCARHRRNARARAAGRRCGRGGDGRVHEDAPDRRAEDHSVAPQRPARRRRRGLASFLGAGSSAVVRPSRGTPPPASTSSGTASCSTTTGRRRPRSGRASSSSRTGLATTRRPRFRSDVRSPAAPAMSSTRMDAVCPMESSASSTSAVPVSRAATSGSPRRPPNASYPTRSRLRRALGCTRPATACDGFRDGTIEFLGRDDDQLKIRGFRVEPAEVEAALRKLESVQRRGRDRAATTAMAIPGSSPTSSRRRRSPPKSFGATCPSGCPSSWCRPPSWCSTRFPRTPSGKVDRLSLPAPEDAGSGATAYVAPRTPTEEAVAAIWASVLGVEKVGVEDDFFAIGGHSLLATQIVAQVRSDFSINLPLHALFSSPTVASLSQQIVELLGESGDSETEELLAQLEGLSDEEAERLLSGESRGDA